MFFLFYFIVYFIFVLQSKDFKAKKNHFHNFPLLPVNRIDLLKYDMSLFNTFKSLKIIDKLLWYKK